MAEKKMKWNKKAIEELGPLMEVRFMNNEIKDGDAPYEVNCNYQGYHIGPLETGKVYSLPVMVVKHLQSLCIPKYTNKVDPVDGQIRSMRDGEFYRFSLQPMNMDAFMPDTGKKAA